MCRPDPKVLIFRVLIEYIYVLPNKIEWFERINSVDEGDDNPLITLDGRWVFKKESMAAWSLSI